MASYQMGSTASEQCALHSPSCSATGTGCWTDSKLVVVWMPFIWTFPKLSIKLSMVYSYISSKHVRSMAVLAVGSQHFLTPPTDNKQLWWTAESLSYAQGTVLGPILFLVHIAGIADSLSADTEASSFADDTRVLRGIKNVTDCTSLQSDLVKVYRWAEAANMHFNTDKFECLRFWAKAGDAPDFKYLAPDNAEIQVKSNLRDLGVEISSDFTFKIHISKTVTAASRLAGWALRTFRRRGFGVMKTIWKSIIQPRLDYCSQLWSPDDQYSINSIESVQRHFLSKVSGLASLNHWERLKRMGFYSQERRRERYMIIFVWKISQGLVQGYTIDFNDSERRGMLAVTKPYISCEKGQGSLSGSERL